MVNDGNFYHMSPPEGATTFSLATLSMKGLNVTLNIDDTHST